MRIDHIQYLNAHLTGLIPVLDNVIADVEADLSKLKSLRTVVSALSQEVQGTTSVTSSALGAIANALGLGSHETADSQPAKTPSETAAA